MRIAKICAECLFDKQKHLTEDKQYLAEIKHILDNRDEDDIAPYMVYLFNRVYEKHFGQRAPYKDIKKKYNDAEQIFVETLER